MSCDDFRESRRTFLRRAALTIAAGGTGRSGHAAGQAEVAGPPYPSHGPSGLWSSRSRELIPKLLLAPPRARRADQDLVVSCRLENVYYLKMGRFAVLVDTGFDHQVNRHLDNFKQMGCDLSRIVGILATHSHVDHTGGLSRAKDRLGVPVVAHRNAFEPIGKGDLLRTAATIPELKGWEFAFPPCKIDEAVDDGDRIAVGDERIDVHHLPGHTPDSLGFVWREHFFTGDTVLGGGGVGWANARWLSNYADHAESIRRLAAANLPAKTFHAGHGAGLPYDAEVLDKTLKKLRLLMEKDADPCNHTPRTARRTPDQPRRVLRLPL